MRKTLPYGTVSRRLRRLPTSRLLQAAERVGEETRRRKVFFYFREGRKKHLPVALKPCVLTPEQRRVIGGEARMVQEAALRVFPERLQNPRRWETLLPFEEEELRCFRDAYSRGQRRPETLFARLDLSFHPGRSDWGKTYQFIEANLCGIGATYYAYSAGQIARDVLAPLVQDRIPLDLRGEDDLPRMILRTCQRHGARIGRPDPTVGFLEFRTILQGPYEQETMQELYREQGYRTIVVDPSELEVRRGELYGRGLRIDVLYRDPSLPDLLEWRDEGGDWGPIGFAFRENRMVSSLAGEADHKGLFEIFSGPDLRFFPPEQRRVLRRRIPWTRVLRETRTTGPDGRPVDLPDYVRRHPHSLVLKPNRDYGGHGILFGVDATPGAWDSRIDRALREPGKWVAQTSLPLHTDLFPILRSGTVRWEPRYLIAGVHAVPEGTAFLMRMSENPIVNITKGGALLGVLEGAAR